MDPELLEKDELEYELSLRNLSSLSTARLKTATLLRVILEEERGDAQFPVDNLAHVIPDSEYNLCMGKLGELGRLIEQGISNRDEGLILRCYTRAVHLSQRTNRLPFNDVFIGVKALEIKEKSIKLLDKVSYVKSNRARNRNDEGAGASYVPKDIEIIGNDLERLETLEREISRLQSSLHEINLQQRNSNTLETNTVRNVPITSVPEIQLNASNPFLLDVEQSIEYQHSSPYRASTIPIQSNLKTNNRQLNSGNEHFNANRNQLNIYPSQFNSNQYNEDRNQYRANRDRFNEPLQRDVPNQYNHGQFNDNYRDNYNERFNDRDQFRENNHPYRDMQPNRGNDDYNQFGNRSQNNYQRGVRQNFNNRERKQIPVQQWKISYNGENNLNDFLSQIEMFKQMENTSEQELLSTIGYLFTGRASKWLRVNYNKYQSWENFKRALREEFLPIHSDFNIIHDLDRRYQQKNETFSEYLSSMLLLFSYMSDPPSAQHQLYYIRKNMSPAYAMAIASQSFETIEQLAVICKRMDDTRNMLQRRGDGNVAMVPERNRSLNRNNPFIYELDELEDEEIQAFENRVVKCWDCLENGHSFRACTNPQGRKFCFICGRKEFTSRNCPQCSRAGNGRTNLAQSGTGQVL